MREEKGAHWEKMRFNFVELSDKESEQAVNPVLADIR
jgi:hypothetical protein